MNGRTNWRREGRRDMKRGQKTRRYRKGKETKNGDKRYKGGVKEGRRVRREGRKEG